MSPLRTLITLSCQSDLEARVEALEKEVYKDPKLENKEIKENKETKDKKKS